MNRPHVVIIGAGPYGLSVASHLAARNVAHRVFGQPMAFWSRIAQAGRDRYLKSYCFGTSISTPNPGFTFGDYNRARGLETFEPCSMENFSDYGLWFQQRNVAWTEPVDVVRVQRRGSGFLVSLASGEDVPASQVVIATGLAYFAHTPPVLAALPAGRVTHTAHVDSFAAFKGLDVAVVGAGQSALEAAALLHEYGARPQLFIREPSIRWMDRVSLKRSLWRRLRSPISGLGTGPKAWVLTNFPGLMRQVPDRWRTSFVQSHLPPEGAWWLRDRVETRLPVHTGTMIVGAHETGGRVAIRVKTAAHDAGRDMEFDHVMAGTGYDINVDRLDFLDRDLRDAVARIERSPRLDDGFQASVRGLRFIGPASAMCFGPLFRFVVGADYTARVVTQAVASALS